MLKLIQNEFGKIFHKRSTYILIAIMVLLNVGLQMILRFVVEPNRNNYYVEDESDLRYQIDYAKSSKYEGYELDIEFYQYAVDHELYNLYEGWKGDALREAYYTYRQPLLYEKDFLTEEEKNTLEKNFQDILDAVEKDDWRSYYAFQVKVINENQEYSAEEKESQIFFYQYMLDENIEPGTKDWREECAQTISNIKSQILSMEQANSGNQEENEELKTLKENLKIYEYQLEHNIKTVMGTSEMNISLTGFWNNLYSSISFTLISCIFMVIIAGGIVSREFTTGTIKFLLINPVSRKKIIVSKFFTVVVLSYALLAVQYLLNLLTGAILYGGVGDTAAYLYIAGDTVKSMSGYLYIMRQYLLESIGMMVTVAMAFAISSLLRSASIAIGISLACLLAGSTLAGVMSALGLDWGRYLLFSNIMVNDIANGNTFFAYQTVKEAMIIIIVYMVVFLLTAYDGFVRREV